MGFAHEEKADPPGEALLARTEDLFQTNRATA